MKDPKRVRAGKLAKTKGAAFEREVCKRIRDAGFEAERGKQYRGGNDSPDIRHSIPNVHIEAKHRAGIDLGTKALRDALDQAYKESSGETPVVVWRKTGGQQINVTWLKFFDGWDSTLTCSLDDWLKFAAEEDWR